MAVSHIFPPLCGLIKDDFSVWGFSILSLPIFRPIFLKLLWKNIFESSSLFSSLLKIVQDHRSYFKGTDNTHGYFCLSLISLGKQSKCSILNFYYKKSTSCVRKNSCINSIRVYIFLYNIKVLIGKTWQVKMLQSYKKCQIKVIESKLMFPSLVLVVTMFHVTYKARCTKLQENELLGVLHVSELG